MAAWTFFVAATAPAQVPRGGWVTGTTYQSLLVFNENFGVLAGAPGFSGGSMVVDDEGVVFTFSQGVVRMHYDASQVPAAIHGPFVLTIGLPPPSLTVTRYRVWSITRGGDLAYLDKVTLNQAPTFLGNVRAAGGIQGNIVSMTTDGREAFFAVDVTASDAHHVFAVDLQSSPLSVRPIASLPVGRVRRMPTLALARDGHLLVMDQAFLHHVDTRTGAVTFVEPLPPALNPGAFTDVFAVAYDPWSDVVAMCTTSHHSTYIYTRLLTGGAFALSFFWLVDGSHTIGTTSEQPFELFGIGCPNATGRDPRLGWQGLPRQGQSFAVTLRDAEPNGFAVFWLGLSDTFWAPFGALPFATGPLGAPGCRLLVSADVSFPVAVDGNGRARQDHVVPVNAALAGWELYAQTASSSGSNALGFAASDGLVIRLR